MSISEPEWGRTTNEKGYYDDITQQIEFAQEAAERAVSRILPKEPTPLEKISQRLNACNFKNKETHSGEDFEKKLDKLIEKKDLEGVRVYLEAGKLGTNALYRLMRREGYHAYEEFKDVCELLLDYGAKCYESRCFPSGAEEHFYALCRDYIEAHRQAIAQTQQRVIINRLKRTGVAAQRFASTLDKLLDDAKECRMAKYKEETKKRIEAKKADMMRQAIIEVLKEQPTKKARQIFVLMAHKQVNDYCRCK